MMINDDEPLLECLGICTTSLGRVWFNGVNDWKVSGVIKEIKLMTNE